ncbi:alpha/beta fold hydrolase [Streptomyces sporangiiformans]|uniref:Alpha/beta fold hydrolase n=2 Tax=Streptomyces sporangiiformans TaxID=2315329 RepID=A0A505DJW3_9ACTN|nr:alpha/beta fold hydrolase [Streptomyces sporangiiformans]
MTHYQLAGPDTGPLVLLTPGNTIPLGYWDAIAADLHAHGLRTLAYSAYGRGWSDRVEGPYDQALFLRQLSELLDAVAPRERVHVVGTSMGGLIAMAFATQAGIPTPLSLTLIGPAGLAEQNQPLTRLLAVDPLARLLGRLFGHRFLSSHLGHNVRTGEDTDRLRRLVGEPYRFHGSIYALLSTLRDFPLIGQHDLYRRAGRLPVPKLLLWGKHDQVTPIEQLDTVRDLFPPDDLHVLDHCGHMVPFEDPHGTARLLATFFEKIN